MKNTALTVIKASTLAASCILIGGACSHHKGGEAGTYYSGYGTAQNPEYSYSGSTQGTTIQGTPVATIQGTQATQGKSSQEQTQSGSEIVIPLYQENVVVGKREVDAGTVHLRKVVHTETVNQPVELRHETLSINREAGEAQTAQAQNPEKAFQEQEFTIQLRREEPVIDLQVVQSGRVVAQKQEQPQSTTVQRQVRREEIAVDKGNAQNVTVSENVGAAGNVGAASSPGAESRGAGSSSTITDLSTLADATDTSSISGRSVQLSNVKVQQVVDPNLISVVGEGAKTPIYAHLQQPVQNLKPGDKINLTGMVQEPSKAPGLAATLSSSASQTIESQRFFVEAQSAELSRE
jgi:stress response protein YsnF